MLIHRKDATARAAAGCHSSTPLPRPEDISAETIRLYIAHGRDLRAQYLRDLGHRLGRALRGGAAARRTLPAGETDGPASQLFHDLRTPLTSIRAFGELLQANPDLPRGQRSRYLAILLIESRRLELAINRHEAQVH
ncbi:MAG: hypothetical protein H6907_09670 [Hyphomicrobiales bacterium]|nr:hypothetical protein [Hyphomicrobiales bacterium]MCP5371987.1 hypothetical protein [Hyphomicrobiales bacterium]